MNFTKNANINMSGLRGYYTISFAELVEIFGEPDYGPNNYDMDKVTCEWRLKFEDGTIASIYDYKTNRTPFGEYEWHIGGHEDRALELVADTITMHRDRLVRMIKEYQ